MRTLIENIVNSELSMLVERRRAKKTRRRTNRRSRARLTPAQRRERSYRRAFSAGVDDKAVDDFIRYITVTRDGCLSKPYSWSLTRTVWAAKRIYEFAKTFKERPKNIVQADTVLRDYFNDYFLPMTFEKANADKSAQPDIYKRLTYILKFLEKAERYGKKNRWGVVASNILVTYSDVYQRTVQADNSSAS